MASCGIGSPSGRVERFQVYLCVPIFVLTASIVGSDQRASDADTSQPAKEIQRFEAYEPTHAIWQVNKGIDDALNVRHSFRYFLTPPQNDAYASNTEASTSSNGFWTRWQVFLSYTGEFDFYWGRRPSSPVVGREHLPALHFRYVKPWHSSQWLKYLDLSFQHRSNGQTIDAADHSEHLKQIHDSYGSRHPIFDRISRSANLFSVEFSGRLFDGNREPDPTTGRCSVKEPSCLNFWVRANFYLSDDNEVTWRLAPSKASFSKYESVRAIGSKTLHFGSGLFPEVRLVVRLVIGRFWASNERANPSLDISGYFPIGRRITVPLFVECHFGPMGRLSDYTRSQTSCGFGVRTY